MTKRTKAAIKIGEAFCRGSDEYGHDKYRAAMAHLIHVAETAK